MITLIIVDPQYDFIEGGKLPIIGGTKALDNIARLIESGKVGRVVITQDSHRPDHCSFKWFGGQFPEHCIMNSHGYLVYEPIEKAIKDKNIRITTIEKGHNEEEFSGFTGEYSSEYYNHVELKITNGSYWNNFVTFRKDDTIVICGLAGDICVLNTIKAILPAIPNLKVYLDGIASLDDRSTLLNFMKENNIKEYHYDNTK